MSNTTRISRLRHFLNRMLAVTLLATSVGVAAQPAAQATDAANAQQALSPRQQLIAPIAATMAVGDMAQLQAALNQGLDAGLTVSDAKEILVQLYAYAGFPRTLNALGELMKVLEARKQRGVQDAAGRDPGPVPTGRELLALGTANQTKLIGSPVRGALFEFSPQVDHYLKTHLFGDIFARDNPEAQSNR
jgi:4-carboxymuconolactone decarboxylase